MILARCLTQRVKVSGAVCQPTAAGRRENPERGVFLAKCHNVRYRTIFPVHRRERYAGGPLTTATLAVWAVPEALTQPIVTVSPGW